MWVSTGALIGVIKIQRERIFKVDLLRGGVGKGGEEMEEGEEGDEGIGGGKGGRG